MNKLKMIRNELGITQKELAEKIGISRAQVSNIEQGIRVITARIKRDIVEYLKVNPDWLKTGEGNILQDKYADFDLDEEEREFLDLYESLNEQSKKLIIETMKQIVSK